MSPQKQLNLGFLLYHEENDNQNQMMMGVLKAAQNYNANIIHFISQGRMRTNFHRELQMFLQIIERQNLDGLMFIGWLQILVHELTDLNYQFPIPLYSLGAGLPNIPFAYSDGGVHFRELLIHLIETHHCRRIAYISPLIYSPGYSDNRINIYIEVMQEHGLYDPDLFISAQDLAQAGISMDRCRIALKILLDERQVNFDAIATSYSDEALILLKELKSRGLSVPRDVKLIGYEDNYMMKYAEIPISTIYYPFWEIGYYGCEKFIQILHGQDNRDNARITNVPGKIVLRRSCGCISNNVMLAASNGPAHPEEFKSFDEGAVQRIYREMAELFPVPVMDVQGLFRAFMTDYQAKTTHSFLQALEEQCAVCYANFGEISQAQDFLSHLHQRVLYYFLNEKADLIWLEALFHQARIIIAEKIASLFGFHEVETNFRNLALNNLGQNLMTIFDIHKLGDILAEGLPAVNIPGCFIFLFSPDDMQKVNLIFGFEDGRRLEAPLGTSQSIQNLLQTFTHKQQNSMFSNLLSVNEEFLGLALFEPGPPDERIYFTLSLFLSTALKGAILLERLEKTNQHLKITQQELVEKAHQAGMADIAAGALHNIGNVLNSINNSIYIMRNSMDDSPLKDFHQANQLLQKKMNDLENFIQSDPRGRKLMEFYLKLDQQVRDYQEIMDNHLQRLSNRVDLVHDIISSQQNYAGVSPLTEALDIAEIVEEALRIHADIFEKHHLTLRRNFEDVPKINIPKNKLLHILLNLFSNARDAMLETPETERVLTLTLEHLNGQVFLRVRDTGCGIAPELIQRIFMHGFTTKKRGHGFGLHSCANSMTEMGGRIWAESPGLGQGATFILQFATADALDRPIAKENSTERN